MFFDAMFRVSNLAALLCWAALVLLPDGWRVRRIGIAGVVIALCAAYASLIGAFFFRVEGGGFGSLDAVQRLFESRAVALAGWLHYLAFDLVIGCWIASRCAALGVSRLLRAPLLMTTFMFGPIGMLLYAGLHATHAVGANFRGRA